VSNRGANRKIWSPLILLPILGLAAAPVAAQQSLPQAVDRLTQDVDDLKRKTLTITSDEFGDIYTIHAAGGEVALADRGGQGRRPPEHA
jgi:hypothetical protein